MFVAVGFIRVWVVVAVGAGLVFLVLYTVAPRSVDRLWPSRLFYVDGYPRRWVYGGFVLGVAVPAILVLPVGWRLDPTDDRTGVPFRQDGFGIIFSLLIAAGGVGSLVALPFLYRAQLRSMRRRELLRTAVRAHQRDLEDSTGELVPLLVLLTDHGWPMSIAQLVSKIRSKADDEALLRGSVGPWWPRDRDELAADVAALVDLGLAEEAAGSYAGLLRWRVTRAGEQFVNHPSRRRRIAGGTRVG